MKYVLAIDSFKGCLSSCEAGAAAEEALRDAVPDVEVSRLTVSDGGEGMLDAVMSAAGGSRHAVLVHDAMMRPVTAGYVTDAGGTAYIESAASCGLTLIEPELRSPVRATSYGVGELVADAVRRGCRNIVVGLGGSAVSDAGTGMLRALTDAFADGGTFDNALRSVLGQCRFTIACDVRNPLYGPEGAACVYGPQKGATPDDVDLLDGRARRFAGFSARHFGFDRSCEPGAGAAGGLGYAFMQYLGATVRSGADLMLDMAGFDGMLHDATCVITGEGRADRQTLMGKLPGSVLSRARAAGVPVWLIAGSVADVSCLLEAGFARVEAVTPADMDTAYAMRPDTARENIKETIKRLTI